MPPRARAFTLLEVVIASALTGVLVILALGAIHTTSQPIAVTTQQADLISQGSGAMRTMVQALESAAVQSLQHGSTPTTLPTTGAAFGRTITFRRVTNYDAENEAYLTAKDSANAFREFKFWFEQVGSTHEYVLKRRMHAADGTVTTYTMLHDIRCRDPDAALDGSPDVDPYFSIDAANTRLTIHFRLRRQIGLDATGEPIFSEVELRRDVSLRNNLQS